MVRIAGPQFDWDPTAATKMLRADFSDYFPPANKQVINTKKSWQIYYYHILVHKNKKIQNIKYMLFGLSSVPFPFCVSIRTRPVTSASVPLDHASLLPYPEFNWYLDGENVASYKVLDHQGAS